MFFYIFREFRVELNEDPSSVYTSDVVIEGTDGPLDYDVSRVYSGKLEGKILKMTVKFESLGLFIIDVKIYVKQINSKFALVFKKSKMILNYLTKLDTKFLIKKYFVKLNLFLCSTSVLSRLMYLLVVSLLEHNVLNSDTCELFKKFHQLFRNSLEKYYKFHVIVIEFFIKRFVFKFFL